MTESVEIPLWLLAVGAGLLGLSLLGWMGSRRRADPDGYITPKTPVDRPAVPPGPAQGANDWGPPLCVLTEDNDIEAFAALPDCEACEGSGKDVRDSYWDTADRREA